MKKFKGLTLVEIVIAIALMGIISVGFISVFASQLSHIILGSEITVDAFNSQGQFEDLIYDAKIKLQKDESLSTIPEWSQEMVEVLGEDVALSRLKYTYPENNRESTVYLSEQLAKIETRSVLTVENVSINVSNDPSNLIADLTTAPKLTAQYTDNSSQTAFYSNLFRWWRTEPGVELSDLVFPDDFTLIPVSQSANEIDNLLDKVGANSYVVLTVTPVDIHGYRGTTVRSDNIVYVKGAEWRIGVFPWVDMNNNYELDASDHQLVRNSLLATLDARNPYPDPVEPSLNLNLKEGSLFVPMRINPAVTLEPGNEAIVVSGIDKVEWLIERNINLSKDISAENGTDIILKSGYGTLGGNIFLHPYVKVNPDGTPVVTGGVVEILPTGVSLATSGNIIMETVGRGSIQFYGNAELTAENIHLDARGNINMNKSMLVANNTITLDNSKDLFILGSRKITLNEVDFLSSNSGATVQLISPETVLFKGGSWSSNQTLEIPEGNTILLQKGVARVNNLGLLNLGNTSKIQFATSMIEDISNQMRLRIVKFDTDTLQIIPHNYVRNIGYAGNLNNLVLTSENFWTNIGQGQNNIEFSARILSGDGEIDDVKFSFDGNDKIKISANTTTQTNLTKVRLEFRDKYSNNQIQGAGIFNYSIDASGNATIEVEEEIPLNMYLITFNSNGGTPVATMEKAYGDPITPPPAPTKTGHTFGGWHPALPTFMPSNHLNVEAIWTPNTYTVTLFGQGGLPDEQTKTVTYNQPYGTLAVPTRAGYTHLGWYTSPSGAGTKIESTDLYLNESDQSLYSRWSVAQYTVSFNLNGPTGSAPSSITVTYEQPYGTLPIVTRAGYNFTGWYTSSTGGTKIESSTVFTGVSDQTLFAQWSQIPIPPLTRTGFSSSGRSTFTLTFSNNIASIVPPTSTSLGTPIISTNTVTYNDLTVGTGTYSVRVRDIYGQELTINLRLSRIGFIFYYYWWDLD